MSLLIIIAGICLLLGGYLLINKTNDAEIKKPAASPFKLIFAIAGLACWGIAAYLFYNLMDTETAWQSFTRFVFACILFGSGIAFFNATAKADQKHAENMAARASAKAEHTKHEEEQIRLKNAKQNAEREQRLKESHAAAEQARYDRNRMEEELKQVYVEEARLKGLDVQSYIQLKLKEAEKEADFEDFLRREQIRIQTEAILIQQQVDAANQIERNKIKAELNSELRRLLIEREEVKRNETNKTLRKELVKTYDEEIKAVKAELKKAEQYDGQANRFLQTPNRQETKRIN